jgi:hypothetical protein
VSVTSRCRLFDRVGNPILFADGTVCLPGREDNFVVHLYHGKSWSTVNLPDPDSAKAEYKWHVADERNRVWTLYVKLKSKDVYASVFDPLSGTLRGGLSLKTVLDDPGLCPKTFVPAEFDFRLPVIGGNGFAAAIAEDTVECRVNGKWLPQIHYFRSFLKDHRDLPGPCYMDAAGRLCAEYDRRVFALVPGEMYFRPAPELLPKYFDKTGMTRHHGGAATNSSLPFQDTMGIAWEFRDGALVRSAYDLSATVVPASENPPLLGLEGIAAICQDGGSGIFVLGNTPKAVHIQEARKSVETKATVETHPSGWVQLYLSDAAELSYAWRIDGEEWLLANESDPNLGPFPSGRHTLDVYAFDEQLNTAPSPVRFELSLTGDNSLDTLVSLLVSPSQAQRNWAANELKHRGAEGRDAVRKARDTAGDEQSRRLLDALFQQMETEDAAAATR